MLSNFGDDVDDDDGNHGDGWWCD